MWREKSGSGRFRILWWYILELIKVELEEKTSLTESIFKIGTQLTGAIFYRAIIFHFALIYSTVVQGIHFTEQKAHSLDTSLRWLVSHPKGTEYPTNTKYLRLISTLTYKMSSHVHHYTKAFLMNNCPIIQIIQIKKILF